MLAKNLCGKPLQEYIGIKGQGSIAFHLQSQWQQRIGGSQQKLTKILSGNHSGKCQMVLFPWIPFLSLQEPGISNAWGRQTGQCPVCLVMPKGPGNSQTQKTRQRGTLPGVEFLPPGLGWLLPQRQCLACSSILHISCKLEVKSKALTRFKLNIF